MNEKVRERVLVALKMILLFTGQINAVVRGVVADLGGEIKTDHFDGYLPPEPDVPVNLEEEDEE